MAVRLRCSQGHEWEFAEGNESTLPLSAGHCPMCGSPSEHVSLVGAHTLPINLRTTPSADSESVPQLSKVIIAGYELLAEIGRGGMGVVYRARQLSLRRIVALKLPHDSLSTSEPQIERFRGEAESVAALRHPHIVQIYDYGVHAGRPYFSMEFLDGGSLAQQVANSHVPPRPAAHLVALLARAVQAAHEAGVIHRDLKPANVLVDSAGVPKISDFGLALSFAPGQRPGVDGLEGTPSYMAPEQAAAQADQIGPATDIYGLGAILYRLLTGRPPFEARNVDETLERVRNIEPMAPRQVQSAVPRDLEAICLKCLRKEPDDRYASAAELAEDLDRFLTGDAVIARPAPLAEQSMRLVRRRPAAMLTAMLIICGALAAFWYWHAYQRVQVDHIADMVTRWGAPIEFRRLSDEEMRHREASLRFHTRGGKVMRIEIVDAAGALTNRHQYGSAIAGPESWMQTTRKECQFHYENDGGGRVATEVACDALGDVVWSFQYTSPTAGYFKDRSGFPAPQTPSGATFIEYTYTADGLAAKERYRGANGEAKPDGFGNFGTDREYRSDGRVVRQWFVGSDDRPRQSSQGIAGFAYDYDSAGNLVQGEVLDSDRQRGTAATGISLIRFESDARGNFIRYSYFDRNADPCLWSGEYHSFTLERDDSGRTKKIRLLGSDGKLKRCSAGFAGIALEYDDGCLPTRQSYFDVNERRCNSLAGFCQCVRRYDARGDCLEESYFDFEQRPVIGPNGIHKCVQRWKDGNRVEVWMIDIDKNPKTNDNGVSHQRFVFDDRHRQIRVENVGDDDGLFVDQQGIAAWSVHYDASGKVVEHRFLGPEGNPCRNVIWSWGERYEYDASGNRTKTIPIDRNGKELAPRVVVIEIKPGRAAERAGLRLGDIVERYAGRTISVPNDVVEAIDSLPVTETMYDVAIRRTGQAMVIRMPAGSPGANFGKRFVDQ